MDLKHFFKHFQRIVIDKRYNELQAEYGSREKLPKLRMKKLPMLNQVVQIYTPRIFEKFQEEYDEYQGTLVKSKDESQPKHEYVISIHGRTRDYKVLGNRIKETISCSCRKFESFGILCCHGMKVLDVMDIKFIPTKYIMKRWTRDARFENVKSCTNLLVESDYKLKVSERYRILCPTLIKIVSRAAECEGAFAYLANETLKLGNTVEDICKIFTNACSAKPESDLHLFNANKSGEDLLKNAKGFKKKNKTKGGKRRSSWVEKQRNTKKISISQNKTVS